MAQNVLPLMLQERFAFTPYRIVECAHHSVLGWLYNALSKHVIGTKGLTSVHSAKSTKMGLEIATFLTISTCFDIYYAILARKCVACVPV